MSLSGSSRNGSRQPSEDWVRQANDLSIDSPLMTDTMNEALQGTIVERYPITDEDIMMVSLAVHFYFFAHTQWNRTLLRFRASR